MIRRSPAACAVALALLATMAVAGESRAAAPASDRIYSNLEERIEPIWVSAEEAVVGVSLRQDLFAPHERATLELHSLEVERILEGVPSFNGHDLVGATGQLIEPEACPAIHSAYVSPVFETGKDGLVEAISSAKAAVSGQIVEITPGFFLGAPSLLLGVAVDEDSRGLAQPLELHHVVYREASFMAGGTPYCGAVERDARRPAIGDEILVFSQSRALDREGLMFAPTDAELVLANALGALLLPPNLAADDELVGVRTISQLRAKLRHGWASLRAKGGAE